MFEEIKRDLNRRQIQILMGLRRVGKSTIFYQLIDQLIKEGVNPFIYSTAASMSRASILDWSLDPSPLPLFF
jgi:predicted AAA+ superfamily ATPase